MVQNSSNAGDTSKRLESEAKDAEAGIRAGVSKNKQQVCSAVACPGSMSSLIRVPRCPPHNAERYGV